MTENWCMSTDTSDVWSLVGTTVIKYWKFWLSENKIRPQMFIKSRVIQSCEWFSVCVHFHLNAFPFVCMHTRSDLITVKALCVVLLWTALDKLFGHFNEELNLNLRSNVIFSVPSRGLMCPGTSFPKDRQSIRCEKLWTVGEVSNGRELEVHVCNS